MAEILEAQERVDDLLFISGHLIEILEQENAALADRKFEVIHDLIEQKTKLSRAYEIRILGLQKSGQNFSGVDEISREKLKAQSARLQELVEINATQLSLNIEVSKQYMEIVAESVKTATPTAGTYGKKGTSGIDALGPQVNSAAFAIDENL